MRPPSPTCSTGPASSTLDGPVVAVLSGGNIDPLLLLRILRHGMAAAGRYLQFRVRVSDRPGHLAQLLADCAAVDANVLEVEHIRTGTTITVDEVEIGLQLETRGKQHCDEVLRDPARQGLPAQVRLTGIRPTPAREGPPRRVRPCVVDGSAGVGLGRPSPRPG